MITPPPARDMARAAWREQRKTAVMLSLITRFHSARLMSRVGPACTMPALLTKTSSLAEGARVSRADDDAPQRRRAAAMRGGGFARMQSVGDSPLDDEWDRAGFRACAYVLGPPAEDLAVRPLTRTFGDRRRIPSRRLQAGAHGIEVLGPQRPGDERPSFPERLRHARAKAARRRLLLVDDRDQLEVLQAERHDDIGGADVRVSAARHSPEAVLLIKALRAGVKVRYGKQDVVHDRRRLQALRGLREVKHRTSFLVMRSGRLPAAVRNPSSVDCDVTASDVAGVVRRDEDRHASDLVGGGKPPHGRSALDVLPREGAAWLLTFQAKARLDVPEVEADDTHVLARPLARQHLGQADQAVLRRGVWGAARKPKLAEDRSDLDDDAAAVGHHQPGRRLRAVEAAAEVGRDDIGPLFGHEVQRRLDQVDAGVVDPEVELPESFDRGRGKGARLNRVADIGGKAERAESFSHEVRSGLLGAACLP